MKPNFVCFTTAHLYCIIIENLQTNYLTKHVFFLPVVVIFSLITIILPNDISSWAGAFLNTTIRNSTNAKSKNNKGGWKKRRRKGRKQRRARGGRGGRKKEGYLYSLVHQELVKHAAVKRRTTARFQINKRIRMTSAVELQSVTTSGENQRGGWKRSWRFIIVIMQT